MYRVLLRFLFIFSLILVLPKCVYSVEFVEFQPHRLIFQISSETRGIVRQDSQTDELSYPMMGQKFTSGGNLNRSFVVNISELSNGINSKQIKESDDIFKNPYKIIAYSKAMAQKFGEISIAPLFIGSQRLKVIQLFSQTQGRKYSTIETIHFLFSFLDQDKLLVAYLMKNKDGTVRVDISELSQENGIWFLNIGQVSKKRPRVMNISNALHEEFLTREERFLIK